MLERQTTDTIELILQAAVEYNKTIHSVTDKKPIDIVNQSNLELKEQIEQKLIASQLKMLHVHNKNKKQVRTNIGLADT